MDVLSEVLRAVRLNGAIFFDVNARQPWAVATPNMVDVCAAIMPGAEHVISFHIMMAGSCWAEPLDFSGAPTLLEPGDVILFPRGDSHVMGSEPGHKVRPNTKLYYRPADQQLPFLLTEIGGTGEPARFVCGYLSCDATPFNPLLDALPRMTVVKAGGDDGDLAASLIKAALAEGGSHRAGGETILAKLSELLLVETVRRHLDTLTDNSQGWLSGLRDPVVGKVLRLIHGEPARDWTIENLARETGLSRSALAERFTRLVQQPPMQYLARWRMQLAARALERPSMSIADVAEEVGYQSEAAFNRAFKKYVGEPPGVWRKTRQPRQAA